MSNKPATRTAVPAENRLAAMLGEQVQEDLAQLDLAERDVNIRGMRIGLACLQAKAALDHGRFMAWREHYVGAARERQVQRLTALAKAFVQDKKLTNDQMKTLLVNRPGNQPAPEQQLMLDFIGGQSQADLFAKHGIAAERKPARPLGGDNALRTWLLKHHPELADKNSARELPVKVRKEYDAYLDELDRLKGPGVDLDALEQKGWHKKADDALAIVRTYFLSNKHYTARNRMWRVQQKELLRACLANLDAVKE